MISPTGRVVMISGANRGFGLAVARRLAREGYRLSLGARDVGELERAAGDLAATDAMIRRYDASDPVTPRHWVDATLERFGRIDALVNNAGMMERTRLEDLDDATLDEIWEVNLKAPLRLTQAALGALRVGGEGRIVNVASLSGIRVKSANAPAYAITKHALVGLSHALRHATWDDGIRVSTLCPGWVATDMTAGVDEDPASMTQPDDLAELVVALLALPNNAAVAELVVNCRLESQY